MPSAQSIRSFRPPSDLQSRCADAAEILERAHESAAALLKSRNVARIQRRDAQGATPRGISTDQEQDLLRAMLVMAAAGLDATLKQLIRDAVPVLFQSEKVVREEVEKFAGRQLKSDTSRANNFLARALTSDSPQGAIIDAYIDDLTAGSLQSAEELIRVTRAVGLTLKVDEKTISPIFAARNKILHELDVSLERNRRFRNQRSLTSMVTYANTLLAFAQTTLDEVNAKLAANP